NSQFPPYIVGDSGRLRQIIVNLVGNAVKFTDQGGITIRLYTKQDNSDTPLIIEVEDTGSGISQEDQSKVFAPFKQVGKLAGKQGTGLGLSITRQFVQLMGGDISLESTPGKGSIFRISLPIQEVSENDIHEAVGFEVKIANNGKEGVELFQSWKPDLIWMDRLMPVMDGLEATQRIRELPQGKDVKIIALTASAFQEERNEMLKGGADDCLSKPYRATEIYASVAKYLGVEYLYEDLSKPSEQTNEKRK
ncbi:MAG: ATP-binding protein, partial [Reinekea sp.]